MLYNTERNLTNLIMRDFTTFSYQWYINKLFLFYFKYYNVPHRGVYFDRT